MNPNKLHSLTGHEQAYLRRNNSKAANWMLEACDIIEDYADNQQAELSFNKTPNGWQVTWQLNGRTDSTTGITLQDTVISVAREIHEKNHAETPWRQDGIPVFE